MFETNEPMRQLEQFFVAPHRHRCPYYHHRYPYYRFPPLPLPMPLLN